MGSTMVHFYSVWSDNDICIRHDSRHCVGRDNLSFDWSLMGNQTEYFERTGYRPEYSIGDRVFGHYHGIPFAGTVGNDTLISPAQGPRISIHLDLPIRLEGTVKNVIIVQHRDIRRMKEF
jgi:hypothetical protein